MNCTVVITKEYKRPLVLETLITADLPLFSMNDRFNRVNRPFINSIENLGEIALLLCCMDYSKFTILKSDFEEKKMASVKICVR